MNAIENAADFARLLCAIREHCEMEGFDKVMESLNLTDETADELFRRAENVCASPKLAAVYFNAGKRYLKVAGICVAVEGDSCREVLPESVSEPIPEEEIANAMIGNRPATEFPTHIVRFFRGEKWTSTSLKWAADKINAVAEGMEQFYRPYDME